MTNSITEYSLPPGSLVLVTGATGFTGQNLVKRLLNDRMRVRALGFEPRIDNEQGIADVARWYVERGWIARTPEMQP